MKTKGIAEENWFELLVVVKLTEQSMVGDHFQDLANHVMLTFTNHAYIFSFRRVDLVTRVLIHEACTCLLHTY